MAARLGLAETVHLVGFYPDIRAAYWSSDFFVLPTYYDPCSLVVFEALACGLPVITTVCNGAGELMTDGREGYVITAPDALGELSAALDHMTDDEARARMSAHAARLGRAQTARQPRRAADQGVRGGRRRPRTPRAACARIRPKTRTRKIAR